MLRSWEYAVMCCTLFSLNSLVFFCLQNVSCWSLAIPELSSLLVVYWWILSSLDIFPRVFLDMMSFSEVGAIERPSFGISECDSDFPCETVCVWWGEHPASLCLLQCVPLGTLETSSFYSAPLQDLRQTRLALLTLLHLPIVRLVDILWHLLLNMAVTVQ